MDVLVAAYQDLDAAEMDIGVVVDVVQTRTPANRRVPTTTTKRGTSMFKTFSKSVAIAALVFSVLGLVACGESSQEKASKQVCSAVKEIDTQIKKLESLPISSSFPTEAKASLEAIDKSLKRNQERGAQPRLRVAYARSRRCDQELPDGTPRATKSIASAAKSSSAEAAMQERRASDQGIAEQDSPPATRESMKP